MALTDDATQALTLFRRRMGAFPTQTVAEVGRHLGWDYNRARYVLFHLRQAGLLVRYRMPRHRSWTWVAAESMKGARE